MDKLLPAVRNGMNIVATCPINAHCQCQIGKSRKRLTRCGYYVGLQVSNRGIKVRCNISKDGQTFK